MLPNSNRTLVYEHSSWELKRAEWSRNTLCTQSSGNEKSETHLANRFLIKTDRFFVKEKRKATAQPDSPPMKERREKPLKEKPSLIQVFNVV